MTHPPNQPGPYGPDPYGRQQPGDQYGQVGQPYGPQPGFSGGERPKRKAGPILAAVAIAVVVLGVVGYLLTEGDGSSNSASEDPTSRSEAPTPADEDPISPGEPTDEPTGGNGAGVSEEEIQQTAQSYVDAVNAQDEQSAMQHTCDTTDPGALYEAGAGSGTVFSLGDVHLNGETYANVDVIFGDSANDNTMPLAMTVQDGSWCVEY